MCQVYLGDGFVEMKKSIETLRAHVHVWQHCIKYRSYAHPRLVACICIHNTLRSASGIA